MNIIEHLSRTITPVLLNNVSDTDGNRANLLEKVYAIIVARLADDNVANDFANTNVVNDDVGFFDRFLPQLSHRNDMVHQLSTHYSVPEQETSSLISRAAPMVYNELRNLAGTTPLHTFLRSHVSSLASVIPAWAYTFLPAGILTALNVNTTHATNTTTTPVERVETTTATREHLVPVVEKKGMSPLLPIIGLLILGALAWALMKGCQKDPAPVAKPTTTVTSTTTSTTKTTTVASTTDTTAVVAPVTSAASGTSTTTTTTTVISSTEPSVFFENGHLKFYFATDKDAVAGNAKEKANEILAAAKTGTILGISGYTDSTGDAAHNADLSKRRAAAVKKFLMDNGVPESQLKLIKPSDSVGAVGKDQEGRRVEVYAIGKDDKEIALPSATAVGTAVGNAVGTAVGTTAHVAGKTADVVGDAAKATVNATKDVAHGAVNATKDAAHATSDATKSAANAAANAADTAANKATTTTTTTTTK